jgi:hypothetical protein
LFIEAVVDGVGSLSWQEKTFAYVDTYLETRNRYICLKQGQNLQLPDSDSPGLVASREPLESRWIPYLSLLAGPVGPERQEVEKEKVTAEMAESIQYPL